MNNLLRQYIREAIGEPITLTLQSNQILALADVLGMHVENLESIGAEDEDYDYDNEYENELEYDPKELEIIRNLRDRLEQWLSGLTEEKQK